MQANRTLGIVVLLVVAAATAVWFVSRGGAGVDLPSQAGPAQPGAEPTAADAATGSLARAPAANPDLAVDATSRVEAASAAPAIEAALLGRVVDDRGQPVAGALVRDARGLPFGADAFDGDMFEAMANDPEGAIARVRAARREGRDTTTDVDGRFRLAVPDRGGMVSLRVEARGHQLLDRNVARPTAAELDVGVLQLERGAIVSGRVVDRAGVGIEAALVLREPGGPAAEWMGGVDMEFPGSDDADSWLGERARTDAEGRFELSHMGPGEFTLRARHPDHPFTRQAGLTVAAGAALQDLVLVLEPGAAIRGRVVGVPEGAKSLRIAVSQRRDPAPAGAPEGPFAFFGGAEVFDDMGGFGERSATVAADGTFELRGLRIGRAYRVWATQTGRGMLGNSACTQRLEVTTPIEGIELRYDPGVTVTFQVVDADGAPVERLWVNHFLRGGGGMEELMGQAMARRGRSADHADGRVTIANLRPKDKQSLTLTVDAIGFAPFERKDIALPRSGDLDLGIVRLAPVPVLRVQVLSSSDGTPIAGASVRAREQESDDPQAVSARVQFGFFADRMGGAGAASGKTGDDGRCALNAPVGKPFVVTVTDKAHARDESAPLTLEGLAGKEYVVRLLRGGTVEVTAVDAEGAVATGQRIEHRAPDGSRDDKTSSDAGVVTFERLTPGEHQFRIGDRAAGGGFMTMTMEMATGQPNAAEAGWQRVQVDDGALLMVELVKSATAELRGVVRENGLPVAGARITFLKGAESNGLGGDLAEMMADFGGRGGGGGGGGRSTRSGADGSYQLRELPEGSHRLRITTGDRSMPALVAVQLRGADNVFDVDLDVSSVRGLVRDADGQPLAGATVRVAPVRESLEGAPDPMAIVEDMVPGGLDMFGGGAGGKSAKSDDSGRYELRGVQAGTSLQVRATAKGHAPAQSPTFQVTAGGTKEGVDLQLRKAGRIKVTMATKTPFAFATATLLDAGGNVDKDGKPVVQMLRNGAGTLDGLRAGRWRVTVRTANGEAEPPRDVDVVAGDTATIAF